MNICGQSADYNYKKDTLDTLREDVKNIAIWVSFTQE